MRRISIYFLLFPVIVLLATSAGAQNDKWLKRFLTLPMADSCRAYLLRLTEEPHVAGTEEDYQTAEYVLEKFRSFGIEADMASYDVYLPYPVNVRFELTRPIRFSGPTPEAGVERDKDAFASNVMPPFHGYSANGHVAGQVIYANYGLPEDYDKLEKLGVEAKGKIVLVRYGKSFRGVKVKAAEERGAAGVIIYSDPTDDGYMQGDIYPHGPYRPETAVQRGSVQYIFEYPGDPLTPGWAATPTAKRLGSAAATNLPRIPSLPISYGDAEKILRHLAGANVPKGWQGGLPFAYHVGPGPAELQLDVELDYQIRPIWNVIATIRGKEEPEKIVVVGNHRDAWTYGAVDPNSGTSVMLEMARTVGQMMKEGFRPRRTVVFASWDGEEYGLLGSTEWVEEHKTLLANNCVTYINIDVGVCGDRFGGGASPALRSIIQQCAGMVTDPATQTSVLKRWWQQQNEEKKSKEPDWAKIDTLIVSMDDLGSGSDYTAFLDHLGVPCMSIGFGGPYGVYHALHDNFFWMSNFGDPTFAYHTAMAKIGGLLLLECANRQVLPVDVLAFARDAKKQIKSVQDVLKESGAAQQTKLDDVSAQADEWIRAAENFMRLQPALAELNHLEAQEVNQQFMAIERAFISEEGIPDRPWFKNIYAAPGKYTGYAAELLPGLRALVNATKWDELPREETRLMRSIKSAMEATMKATLVLEKRQSAGRR
jgi:N-acetylated-alpha-linked acidic dipeptidase